MDGSNPQQIAVDHEPITIGRSATVHTRLLHPTISRLHATIERQPMGFLIRDHESRYGTFVNGVRIRCYEARWGDRVQFGTLLVYRCERDGLLLEEMNQGLRLLAAHLDLERNGTTLVKDVSFTIRADSFVGLLAPSGVGKSTLLNCLGGYWTPATGNLAFDDGISIRDVPRQLESYRPMIG